MRANEARVRKLEAQKADDMPILICFTADGERGQREAIEKWEEQNGPMAPDAEIHWIRISYI